MSVTMKFITLLIILSAFVALSSAANLICYFHNWSVYRPDEGKFGADQIDPDLCTHVIYAYIGLNADGTIKLNDVNYDINGLHELDHLLALKDVNPDLKLVFAIGGWTEGSENYSIVAADATLRDGFVKNAVQFVLDNKFDGLSYDWEYPAQRDGSDSVNDPGNYVITITALKKALNDKDLILSSALPGTVWATDTSFPNAKQVVGNLDLAFIRGFDYHGVWETFVGHNAPLAASHLDTTTSQKQQNVQAGIQYWIDKGADPEKLHLGIPLFGHIFTLLDPDDTELYAPNNGSGVEGPYTQEDGSQGYNEICSLDTDWDYYWDDEQLVPHLVKGNQWIGYDDEKSVQLKVDLINSLGLGGAMVWSIDTDDFLGDCGDGPFPITNLIKKGIN